MVPTLRQPSHMCNLCNWQVYEDWDNFKLNDMLEVFGILSVDPALSVIADER